MGPCRGDARRHGSVNSRLSGYYLKRSSAGPFWRRLTPLSGRRPRPLASVLGPSVTKTVGPGKRGNGAKGGLILASEPGNRGGEPSHSFPHARITGHGTKRRVAPKRRSTRRSVRWELRARANLGDPREQQEIVGSVFFFFFWLPEHTPDVSKVRGWGVSMI